MFDVRKLSATLTRNVHPVLYPRMFVFSVSGVLFAYSLPTDVAELRDIAALIAFTWKQISHRVSRKTGKNVSTGYSYTAPATSKVYSPINSDEYSSDSSSSLCGNARNDALNGQEKCLTGITVITPRGVFLVRQLQPDLLFALEGANPPGKINTSKIIPEFGQVNTPYDSSRSTTLAAPRDSLTYGFLSCSEGNSFNDKYSCVPDAPTESTINPMYPTSGSTLLGPNLRLSLLRIQQLKLNVMVDYLITELQKTCFIMLSTDVDSVFSYT